MKKYITALLACLLVLSLAVTAFADGYAQNEADYNDMFEYAAKQTPAITLTDQYFTVEGMSSYSNFKFELNTDSETAIDVFFCLLLTNTQIPEHFISPLGAVMPMETNPIVSFSSSSPHVYEPKNTDRFYGDSKKLSSPFCVQSE